MLCPILVVLLLLLSIARPANAQPPVPPVVVSPVIERNLTGSQAFLGTVMPRFTATIGTAVPGRVVEMLVEEGDSVRAGEPLARLLTETIELEIRAARAELDLRRQELAELENGTRPEELRQAKAKLRAAEARMQYEKQRFKRIADLHQSGQAMSEQERDEAMSAAATASEEYAELTEALELALAGPRVEQIAQARARAEIQEAVVARLEDQLHKHTMVSRFDGFVTAKFAEAGQWVNQGQEVVEVAALNEVEIVVSVAEQYVPNIRIGAAVALEIPAVTKRLFDGKIVAVIPKGDQRSRTFPIRIRVVNPIVDGQPLLKAGMLARVNLPTGQAMESLLVPKDAVVLGGQSPMVYVIRPGDSAKGTSTVQAVSVQLGTAWENWIQVRGGLTTDDQVVVQGNERLRPQQEVTIQLEQTAPSPNKDPGATF